MESIYTGLANAVFGFHLLFVLIVLPSTFALVVGFYRTKPQLMVAHCMGVYTMAVGLLLTRQCPLVPLEHTLREAGGGEAWYRGSFILFVVERATGLQLPVELIASLSILVIALTTVGLARVLFPAKVSNSLRLFGARG